MVESQYTYRIPRIRIQATYGVMGSEWLVNSCVGDGELGGKAPSRPDLATGLSTALSCRVNFNLLLMEPALIVLLFIKTNSSTISHPRLPTKQCYIYVVIKIGLSFNSSQIKVKLNELICVGATVENIIIIKFNTRIVYNLPTYPCRPEVTHTNI